MCCNFQLPWYADNAKMGKLELRAVIKYFHLKGMTSRRKEIFCDMKQALGESAPAYCTVKKWHAEFQRRRSSCDELHRCGRPTTSVDEETVERDNKLIMNDRRLTVCFIAKSIGISSCSVHSILTENLLTKKVSARWVPRMLSDVHGQIELTRRQVYSASLTNTPMAFFHDF